MSFGIKLRNLGDKKVLLWDKIVETPRGRSKRTVITKPAAKQRPTRLFNATPVASNQTTAKSTSWTDNPFIDDDREVPVLFDPVPFEVFQEVIEANSKVGLL